MSGEGDLCPLSDFCLVLSFKKVIHEIAAIYTCVLWGEHFTFPELLHWEDRGKYTVFLIMKNKWLKMCQVLRNAPLSLVSAISIIIIIILFRDRLNFR